MATPLAFNSPDRGVPWDHLRKIFRGYYRLSRVLERYRRQTDRQTDGRAIAYSERELEFTFAKKLTFVH